MPRGKSHTGSVIANQEQVDEVAEIQWYFPNELDEVPGILAQEGVIPHSGGTGILWGGMTRIRGLMDVCKLDLKDCHARDGAVELGAVNVYNQRFT